MKYPKFPFLACLVLFTSAAGKVYDIGELVDYRPPDLTRVEHTYYGKTEESMFKVLAGTGKDSRFELVLKTGKGKTQVPSSEFGLPYSLNNMRAMREGDLIYVTFYQKVIFSERPDAFEEVSFYFQNGAYLERIRLRPISVNLLNDRIVTTFEEYKKKPGENEIKTKAKRVRTKPIGLVLEHKHE